MTDRLSHLKLAMDLGFQLGQGKKVDLNEMADKHLTKECPRCEGRGRVESECRVCGGSGIMAVRDPHAKREDDPPIPAPCHYCHDADPECPDCGGTGRVPKDGTKECPLCGGTGETYEFVDTDDEFPEPCTKCEGTGRVPA